MKLLQTVFSVSRRSDRSWSRKFWSGLLTKQHTTPRAPNPKPQSVLLGSQGVVDPFRYTCSSSSSRLRCSSKETLRRSLTLLLPVCSWISDYNNQEVKGYIVEEQAHFLRTAQQLSALQQQLLAELRQHVQAYQVRHNIIAACCKLQHTHAHTSYPLIHCAVAAG